MDKKKIMEIVEIQIDKFVGSNRRYGNIVYIMDEYELEEVARRIAEAIIEVID